MNTDFAIPPDLFRGLAENSRNVIGVKDLAGRYLFVNGEYPRLFHRPVEDFIGHDDIELFPAEIAVAFRQADQQARAGRLVIEETVEVDGKWRHYLSVKFPLFDAQGQLYATGLIATDITERKEAEARLKDSEQRFRAIADCTVNWEAWWGPEGHLRWLNQVTPALLGYSVAECLAEPDLLRKLVLEEDWPLAERAIQRAMQQQKGENVEFRCRHKDGHRFWLALAWRPIYDESGEWLGWRTSGRDVTERHLAEESLRIYRQHLESAVKARTSQLEAANRDLQETQFAMDRVGIGIYWVDLASGRILDGNRQACELLGYSLDELLQLAVPDLAPEFPAERYAQMAGRIRQQGTARFETCHRRKDGSLMPVEVTAYYSEVTQPPRIIGFVTDISERKRNEAAREAALAAAERLSRLKSEFINNMSHELRTPLNAVIGLASLGSHIRELPRAQEICGRIHEAGRKLLSLIEDVLDFSELETGRLQLAAERYIPAAVVEQVIVAFLPQAEARGLKLSVHGLEQLPEAAQGDPRRLGQVLWQLLDNAVKFTEQGEIRLDCSSDGRALRWQLRDTGIGLSPEHLAGLFRPFEQGDGSMTRRFGGTGLGLALTQRLLQQMGGSIQVESQLGQGTCVSVSLPLAG